MSFRRSPVFQSRPATARLGDPDFIAGLPFVPMVLALVLGLVITVRWFDLHLLAAARLAVLIGPSPLPLLSAVQVGKLMALGGIAAVALGLIVLALHQPQTRADRVLARRFLLLVGVGGGLSILLDLAPSLGLASLFGGTLVAAVIEETVKWTVLASAGLLIFARLVGEGWQQPARVSAAARAVDAGRNGRVGG